jgi:hypothetical protein
VVEVHVVQPAKVTGRFPQALVLVEDVMAMLAPP